MIYLDNEQREQDLWIDRPLSNGIPSSSPYVTESKVNEMIDDALGDYNRTDNFKTVNGETIIGQGNIEIEASQTHTTPVKLGKYLYSMDLESIDYDYAREYFRQRTPVIPAGCSVLRAGNLVGRNLDWYDDYEASFIVRTPRMYGRYASFGVAGGLSTLTAEKVETEENLKEYKILPFYMQDIMNERSLFCEMNVINASGFEKTVPLVEKRDEICALMLVRYIGDNFKTVNEAVAYIRDYVEVYTPATLSEMGYELHYLIADKDKTVILEFEGNGIVITENVNVLTNFKVYGVDFNDDGTVYSPASVVDGKLPTSQGIYEYATGLERWNELIQRNISGINDMKTAMNAVNFSNAYTKGLDRDFWYSEFVGGDITVDTPYDDQDFQERCQHYWDVWTGHTKDDASCWITCHQSIYDFDKMTLEVSSQEGDVYFKTIMIGETDMDDYYTKAQTDGKIASAIASETARTEATYLKAEDLEDYATKDYVDETISEAVSGFTTEEDVETIVEAYTSDFPTDTEVEEMISESIEDRPTFTDLSQAIAAALVNYYTSGETYTKTEVNALIAAIPHFRVEVVQVLPAVGENAVVYLLTKEDGSGSDLYDEYIYINNRWELLGTARIDLSDYYTSAQTNTLLSTKQDVLPYETLEVSEITTAKAIEIVENPQNYQLIGINGVYQYSGMYDGAAVFSTVANVMEGEHTIYRTMITPDGHIMSGEEVENVFITDDFVDGQIATAIAAETARTESTYLKEHQSLSDYYTSAQTDTLLEAKQDVLTAGRGIQIDENQEISINLEDGENLISNGDFNNYSMAGWTNGVGNSLASDSGFYSEYDSNEGIYYIRTFADKGQTSTGSILTYFDVVQGHHYVFYVKTWDDNVTTQTEDDYYTLNNCRSKSWSSSDFINTIGKFKVYKQWTETKIEFTAEGSYVAVSCRWISGTKFSGFRLYDTADSMFKTINNQSILGAGNIEIPTFDGSKYYTSAQTDTRISTEMTNVMFTPEKYGAIANADTLSGTTGFRKTNGSGGGLPPVCTGSDRYGVLLTVSENPTQGQCSQMYFPIDGTYKGRIFYRSYMTGRGWTSWTLIQNETEIGTMISTAVSNKQDTLVSGTNIKTINSQSILGSGNIEIQGGEGSEVSWNQIQTTGNLIAQITIDGETTNVMAPAGGSGGGGETVVELTQAQYDAIVPPYPENTTYIITDAEGIDMGDYASQEDLEELQETVETAMATKADKVNVTAKTSGYQFPNWNNQGVITGNYSTWYSASQKINGSSRNILSSSSSSLPTIYAPTAAGTKGQPLLSNGSGAPVWGSYKFEFISQSAYDALSNPDSTTIYFIISDD